MDKIGIFMWFCKLDVGKYFYKNLKIQNTICLARNRNFAYVSKTYKIREFGGDNNGRC